MEARTPILLPGVEPRVEELTADEEVSTRALEQLLQHLEQHATGYRANRDDADPDFLFIVPVRIFLRGRWRFVRFSVNDTTSPDHFFVEAVSMSGGWDRDRGRNASRPVLSFPGGLMSRRSDMIGQLPRDRP